MDDRKIKNHILRIMKKLKVGSYFIDCSYEPCIVTAKGFSYQDLYGAWVDGKSLVSDSETSCSIMHCGPEPIDKDKADEMIAEYKKGGSRALVIKYGGWSEEDYDAFEKKWRKDA